MYLDKTQVLQRIDTLIFYSLLGFVFIMPFSLGLLNTFLYSIAVLQLIRACLIKKLFPDIKYLKFIFLGILGVVIISFYNVPHDFLHMYFKGLKKICVYMLFSIAIINTINTEERLKKVFISLIAGLIIISLDALFQYKFGYDLFRKHPLFYEGIYTGFDIYRATAAYPHPNPLGTYLSTFFFILPIYMLHEKKLFKGLFFILTFLCGIAICFTFSRGSALATAVASVLALFILRKKEMLLVLVSIVMISFLFLPKDVYIFLNGQKSVSSLLFGVKTKGGRIHTTDRRTLWKTALNMFKKHPLIGIGYYTFSDQYILYREKNDLHHDIRAHSSVFGISAELGGLGLLLFAALFYSTWQCGIQSYKQISNNYLKCISLALCLSLLSLLINATYDSIFRSARLTPFLWLLVGLIFSLNSVVKYELQKN
ncbi:MAG TPA: O-antigen ligase family protein [Bdellovibrionota bacterium]|nr:O-antigen ligase family protein [Bdellovibrionota bacterium]